MSEYWGPVGTMCVKTWHVAVINGQRLRVTGLLEFTNNGTALVWTDSDATSLRLGLAHRQWGSITIDDDND